MANMAFRSWMRVLPLCGVLTLAGGCGGAKEAAAPAQQDPVFKPIELPPGGTMAPGSLTPAAPAAPSAPVTFGAGEPAAMVTDLASGWPVALVMGQEMTARLAADRAAGGRWSLRPASDGGVVVREGEPAYEKTAGGGVEVFRFKAAKAGQTLLTFDYRIGAATAATRSVSYPVTVK
jgi:predicted secreted protein